MRGYEWIEFFVVKQGWPARDLLEELVQAMSEKEARENFEHIARMHDLHPEE